MVIKRKSRIYKDAKEKLNKLTKVDANGCWIYQGGQHQGYGSICWENTNHRAHRLSYELYKGVIPEGMYVCHKCDVRACCNPDHLFLGSPKDNMDDKVEKGRHTKGSECPQAKLTNELVIEALNLAIAGKSQIEIANQMGVTHQALNAAITGKSWGHVGSDLRKKLKPYHGSNHSKAKLNESQVLRIRSLYKDGAHQKDLAKKFNVSEQTVGCIVRRETWKHV